MDLVKHIYHHILKGRRLKSDSRKVEEGEVFLALKGEHFDANEFIEDVLQKNVAAVLCSDPGYRNHPKCVYIPNTLTILQRLAHYHRILHPIQLIAITGSNGKTTTKNLLADIFKIERNIVYTRGNFNNHIGLPITILEIDRHTEFAIIEMGASKKGDIWQLCQIASPDYGIITNVAGVHLEGLDNLQGVQQTKAELAYFLEGTKGMLFYNQEEPSLKYLQKGFTRLIPFNQENLPHTYKMAEEAVIPDIRAKLSNHGQVFDLSCNLYGRYNYQNIVNAIAVALYFRINPVSIQKALLNFSTSGHRSEILKIGNRTIFADMYNANPISMINSIQAFVEMPGENKWIILGDMLELGSSEAKEHVKILTKLEEFQDQFDGLVCIGPRFCEAIRQKQNSILRVLTFQKVEEAKKPLEALIDKANTFLLKGSRSIHLERLLDVF